MAADSDRRGGRSDRPSRHRHASRCSTRACEERPGECAGNGRFAVEAEIEGKSVLIAGGVVARRPDRARQVPDVIQRPRQVSRTETGHPFSEGFYTGEFAERVKQVASLAARNRVRISTLDARGLGRDLRQQNLLGESPFVGNRDLRRPRLRRKRRRADDARARHRRSADPDRNNLRPALDAIATESGTYYMSATRRRTVRRIVPRDRGTEVPARTHRPGAARLPCRQNPWPAVRAGAIPPGQTGISKRCSPGRDLRSSAAGLGRNGGQRNRRGNHTTFAKAGRRDTGTARRRRRRCVGDVRSPAPS